MIRHALISAVLGAALLLSSNVAAAEAPADIHLVKDAHPTLATGGLASARLAELPAGVILQSGQIKITQKDLDADIGKAPATVRPQMKRNLFYVLETKAARMFLEYEASEWIKVNKKPLPKSQADPVQAYLSTLSVGLTVTDAECKDYFDKNASSMGDAKYDDVKGQFRDYLLEQKREALVTAHIAGISERYKIDVNKSWTAKQNSAAIANPIDKARMSGTPTMVDLGADGCIPCEMMTPILESLTKEYQGKANILFVHVRNEPILGARYGVRSIPVQVFFDKNGKEVFRHVGFFPKEQIVSKLTEMGVK